MEDRLQWIKAQPRHWIDWSPLRGGLEALVARSVYYELVNLALDDGAAPVGLWSDGAFFPLGDPA